MGKKKKDKAKEKSSFMDRLSLFFTLVVVAVFAVFIGFLIGEYAVRWVASPELEAVTDATPVQTAPDPLTGPDDDAIPVSTPGTTPPASPTAPANSGVSASSSTPTVSGTSARPGTTAAPTTAPSPSPADASRQTIVRVHVGRFNTRAEAGGVAERLKNETPPIDDAWVLFDQQTGEYRVQVGAFSHSARADELAEELRARNFDAFVVP